MNVKTIAMCVMCLLATCVSGAATVTAYGPGNPRNNLVDMIKRSARARAMKTKSAKPCADVKSAKAEAKSVKTEAKPAAKSVSPAVRKEAVLRMLSARLGSCGVKEAKIDDGVCRFTFASGEMKIVALPKRPVSK